jgi:single-strand DNA-binding protein
MAFSLNKITLIGNLGKDSETRFTTNNRSVTSFSVATVHSYKGKDGNYVNETTWHNCISWELSDYMKEALKKGKKFYVEGRLSKRDYTDKDGVKRFVTEVITEKLIPLEGRDTNGYSQSEKSSSGSFETAAPDAESSNPDDDLPF